VTIHITGATFVGRVAGRLLCYAAPNNASDVAVVEQAAPLTAAHPGSGPVVRGRYSFDLVRRRGP